MNQEKILVCHSCYLEWRQEQENLGIRFNQSRHDDVDRIHQLFKVSVLNGWRPRECQYIDDHV